MLTFRRFGVVIALSLAGWPLQAQTATPTRRAFVDATVGPQWDDYYSQDQRIPGATLWSAVAVGFDVWRSGFEFDVGVPQWHQGFGPLQRYQYVGTTFGFQQQGHFYESSSTVRRRSIEVSVLSRHNVPLNRRATFTWLLGAGYIYRRNQFSSVTNEVLPDGTLNEVNRRVSTGEHNYLAGIVRLDGEFRITPALSIVPHLRFTLFPSLLDDSCCAPRILVTRPEIAVRWRF